MGSLILPPRFVLTIEGHLEPIVQRSNIARGALGYLLARLMTGLPVDDTVFDPFRIRVTIEPDTDGGSEEPDHDSAITLSLLR